MRIILISAFFWIACTNVEKKVDGNIENPQVLSETFECNDTNCTRGKEACVSQQYEWTGETEKSSCLTIKPADYNCEKAFETVQKNFKYEKGRHCSENIQERTLTFRIWNLGEKPVANSFKKFAKNASVSFRDSKANEYQSVILKSGKFHNALSGVENPRCELVINGGFPNDNFHEIKFESEKFIQGFQYRELKFKAGEIMSFVCKKNDFFAFSLEELKEIFGPLATLKKNDS